MERQLTAARLAPNLARHTAGAEAEAVWRDGAIRLRVNCYLTDEEPPSEYIVSARSVVWRGAEVLTVRNPEEWHVLPGGRMEGGETPEQTVRREVLEETGVHIERPRPLGFMHLHHLTPKPAVYKFLYPDFLWAVYLSEAGLVERDHARPADEYEEEAIFRSLDAASALDLSSESRFFLTGAYRVRGGTAS
jgi:ADP-ribose pyrophosphatase YjhB (NUDIX family)